MKSFITMITLMLGISLLASCGVLKKKDEAEDVAKSKSTTSSETDQAATEGLESAEEFQGVETNDIADGTNSRYKDTPWDDPQNPLSETIIYFEFDSSEVPQKYFDLILKHAEYLSSRTSLQISVEGHADERGTREYNIALGEQRADAVARLMKLQGVEEIQVRTVSFGEEKPLSFEHNEDAWNRNRRVEIVYPNP